MEGGRGRARPPLRPDRDEIATRLRKRLAHLPRLESPRPFELWLDVKLLPGEQPVFGSEERAREDVVRHAPLRVLAVLGKERTALRICHLRRRGASARETVRRCGSGGSYSSRISAVRQRCRRAPGSLAEAAEEGWMRMRRTGGGGACSCSSASHLSLKAEEASRLLSLLWRDVFSRSGALISLSV